jgi:hypothetical protein
VIRPAAELLLLGELVGLVVLERHQLFEPVSETVAEAILTPNLVTDRDVVAALEDDSANNRWGVRFRSPQYVAVFARWFDELWASIPEAYLIQSRSGVDEKALEEDPERTRSCRD